MQSRPSIALCHPWLGLGGSEAAVLWGITALRDDYDITIVTSSPVDLDKLNNAYGTEVQARDFRVLTAPSLPMVSNPASLAHWRIKRFERFCRSHINDFDIPLSAYNPIDFGRPGIHLIGDFSWDESTRAELVGSAGSTSTLRKGYRWLGSQLFGTSGRDILNGHDLVAANSEWTAKALAAHYGLHEAPIIYPPVHVERPELAEHLGPAHFVCIGRISPEKKIEQIISILDSVRATGREDVHLTIAGNIGDDDYGQSIRRLVEHNSTWIDAVGYISGPAKFELLASHPYALHACEGEPFGISVAEMLFCGCLPFVPRSGGPVEIVGCDDLCYSTPDEAVTKITDALATPGHASYLRDNLATHGDRFTPEAFGRRLRELVDQFRNLYRSEQAA